ncbi:MAG: hypothetical protein SP4CHLAM5_06380 [Chlamydiia bacterium]|nr:hypothetical protein [Chlamydiia bacterium]MCH9618506.1 hypothetical protein [Chlamydiia bacterium]MCH9623795.1 hypothetical protein [Chlamydiia bacterium]
MTILLVRHGDYNPKYIDPKEGLSNKGKEEINHLLEKLMADGITYDNVYSSPKTRAIQTAHLLAGNIKIQQIELLKPNTDPKILYEFIQTLSGDSLLVGHNPLLSYVSNYFSMPYQFETAGCLLIENKNSRIL